MKQTISLNNATLQVANEREKQELINKLNELDFVSLDEQKEQTFLDIIKGLKFDVDADGDNVLNDENGDWVFFWNSKSNYVYCSHYRYWSFFTSKYGMRYNTIKEFTTSMLKKHLKMGGVTAIVQLIMF